MYRLKLIIQRIFFLLINLSFGIGLLAQEIKESPWHITANDFSNYIGVSMANGRIGMLPSEQPGKTKAIILNNVYDKESEFGVSKVLLGINFANLELIINKDTLSLENCTNWQQVLDMKSATFTTSCRFKDYADISFTHYAFRGMPYSGLLDVEIKTLKKDVLVHVVGQLNCPSEYKDAQSGFKVLKDLHARMPILQCIAKSPFKKHQLATSAAFIFDDRTPELKEDLDDVFNPKLSFTKSIKKNQKYKFAWSGAVCTSQNFSDPKSESERMVIFQLLGNKQTVINRHKELWADLWTGDIEIEGDIESQRDIRLALYHLYSFSREDSNLSIAPMGLSAQGYNGHIFWDTELWMFPPLLAFNQDIAKSLLNYRFDRLEAAKRKAHNYGYNGAMFPWESDDTGEEATPTWALTGTFEHHITADIGIAFWNYYRTTKDKEWLKEIAYPVLKEVADFWLSRSIQNQDGSYSINNVVGANEFYHHADDNAFTNGSAKTVLNYATLAAKELNVNANPKWNEIARKISFYSFESGVTKENKKYDGEIIKQADVNLLAYPLDVVSREEDIRRDLEYYEQKMAAEGPAMSHSVLAVLYARLGEKDKAFELFKRAYEPNKRAPFGALSESAFSNNPYFATGAGGMLQTVLFGFGGLHFTDDGIVQKNPCLPKQWKKLTIKGIGIKKETFVIE